jgi:hypothetical protein
MGNGAWGMGHGAWVMGHGEWGMGNGKNLLFPLPIAQLPMPNYQERNYQLPMPIAQCPLPNAQCPITNYPEKCQSKH